MATIKPVSARLVKVYGPGLDEPWPDVEVHDARCCGGGIPTAAGELVKSRLKWATSRIGVVCWAYGRDLADVGWDRVQFSRCLDNLQMQDTLILCAPPSARGKFHTLGSRCPGAWYPPRRVTATEARQLEVGGRTCPNCATGINWEVMAATHSGQREPSAPGTHLRVVASAALEATIHRASGRHGLDIRSLIRYDDTVVAILAPDADPSAVDQFKRSLSNINSGCSEVTHHQ